MYSVAHLALAAISAFLVVVHVLLWAVVRENRVQLWVAVTYVGYALVNLAIAGSSEAAGGTHNSPVLIALGALAVFPLWLGLLLTAWGVVDRELTTVRKVLLGIAALVALVRVADVVWYLVHLPAGAPVTWETVMNSGATATVYAAWFMTLECGSVCVWEGAAAVRKRPGRAAVLGLLALLAAGVVVREILLTLGLSGGPTLLGTTAVPFIAFSFLLVALDYVAAMRSRRSNVLGEYQPIRPLGSGGMGELYLASRKGPAGFERYVAIKRIRNVEDRGEEYIERFLSEARLAAQLRHPNIVSVYDLGRTEDGWFIVMEYLCGASLLEIRRRAKERKEHIPLEFVVAITECACRGLARAHQAGIVHRDVSPHNIMVTFEGDVKVVDFGIAKEHGVADDVPSPSEDRDATPDSSDLTRTGIVVGKRAYLAPERIAGTAATPASDIFSLGVVLYELLSLRRPFLGKKPTELARAILTGHYPALDRLRPDVPGPLAEIVYKALEPKIEIRYAQAGDMANDLRLVARDLPHADVGALLKTWFPKKWDDEERMAVTGSASEMTAELDNPDLATGPSLASSVAAQAEDELDESEAERVPTAQVSTDD